LPGCFHFLRLCKLFLCAFEVGLGLAPLGDVTRDLGVPDEIAAFAANRVDHGMGPEALPALALPPAFYLDLALAGGDREYSLRYPPRQVLLGIEAADMLADDFFRRISLHSLGPLVPGRDGTIGLQ